MPRLNAGFGVVAVAAGLLGLSSCQKLSAGLSGLRLVADVGLSGHATRFDYVSLNPGSNRLYIAHMGDGSVVVVNTQTRKVAATIGGMPLVRGVLAVPKLNRLFAASAGNGTVTVVDMRSNRIVARIPAGNVDGLAFDPVTNRVFVSDEAGRRDVVIDAARERMIGVVPLGGEAGNTVYDSGSHHILVAVQTSNELAEIEPSSMRIIARYPLPGSKHSHGIALEERTRFAYIAGEQNASVVAFDLHSKRVTGASSVGRGVDVLSVDPQLGRLYVASESGVVCVFDVLNGRFRKLSQAKLAEHAHVVIADPRTHFVYFPLEDVGGTPTLRIMEPAGERATVGGEGGI